MNEANKIAALMGDLELTKLERDCAIRAAEARIASWLREEQTWKERINVAEERLAYLEHRKDSDGYTHDLTNPEYTVQPFITRAELAEARIKELEETRKTLIGDLAQARLERDGLLARIKDLEAEKLEDLPADPNYKVNGFLANARIVDLQNQLATMVEAYCGMRDRLPLDIRYPLRASLQRAVDEIVRIPEHVEAPMGEQG